MERRNCFAYGSATDNGCKALISASATNANFSKPQTTTRLKS